MQKLVWRAATDDGLQVRRRGYVANVKQRARKGTTAEGKSDFFAGHAWGKEKRNLVKHVVGDIGSAWSCCTRMKRKKKKKQEHGLTTREERVKGVVSYRKKS